MSDPKPRNNGYPFMTQAQVTAKLADDESFRMQCLSILCSRQESDELEERATKYTNKRGLRCSESVWMPELLAKVENSPGDVTEEERSRLAQTLPRYRKQIAAHFRREALETDPSLIERAALFGLS